jgi:WD40 repeat protein
LPLSTSKDSKQIKGNEITHYSLKAHNGPIKQLLKTNDGLVLTSSDAKDPVIKLWDLKGLLQPQG